MENQEPSDAIHASSGNYASFNWWPRGYMFTPMPMPDGLQFRSQSGSRAA